MEIYLGLQSRFPTDSGAILGDVVIVFVVWL